MDELRGFNEEKLCRKMFMDDDEFENSKIEFLVLEPVAPKIILRFFFAVLLHNFCVVVHVFHLYSLFLIKFTILVKIDNVLVKVPHACLRSKN